MICVCLFENCRNDAAAARAYRSISVQFRTIAELQNYGMSSIVTAWVSILLESKTRCCLSWTIISQWFAHLFAMTLARWCLTWQTVESMKKIYERLAQRLRICLYNNLRSPPTIIWTMKLSSNVLTYLSCVVGILFRSLWTITLDNPKAKMREAHTKTFVDIAFYGGVIPGNQIRFAHF